MAKMMAKILEKTIKNPLLWQKSCIMAKTEQRLMANGKQFGRYLLIAPSIPLQCSVSLLRESMFEDNP